MALKELPTSWDIDGIDWNDPDPFDVRVINAILLAIRERFSFQILAEKPDFNRAVPALYSQFSPAASGDIFECFYNSFFDRFYTPESVFSGNPVLMTEKWVAERFPLVFCAFPRGASAETYSQYLMQWYQFLNVCRYVYYDDYSIQFEFDKKLDGSGTSEYNAFATAELAYNSAANNFDFATTSSQTSNIYRQLNIMVNYGYIGSSQGYSSGIYSSGCAGICTAQNTSFFDANVVFKAKKLYDLYFSCGFPYSEGELFFLSAPRGENLCEEFSGKDLTLPSYSDIQSMITSEDNDFYVGFSASGIAADLSPSFRFFSDVSDR